MEVDSYVTVLTADVKSEDVGRVVKVQGDAVTVAWVRAGSVYTESMDDLTPMNPHQAVILATHYVKANACT